MTDDLSMDPVFKALADPTRRTILDLLRAEPGLTVGELTASFEVTRFAVMKHLRVLVGAELVTDKRQGKHRKLYLNAVPLQLIQDRWMSLYSRRWAAQLTGLKFALEHDEETLPMSDNTHHYVIHIRTTPEKLWAALTTPEQTRQYFYRTAIEFRPEVGSPIRYMMEGDEPAPAIAGEVLEVIENRRLVHSFESHYSPTGQGGDDPPSKVTYEIEPLGHLCKLTLTHEFTRQDHTFHETKTGWFPVLSGLKTLLETGEPLDIPPSS